MEFKLLVLAINEKLTQRGGIKMTKKEFIFEKTIYLADANIYGNVYFSRYFDWQGMAREEFLKQVLPDYDSFFKSGIKLITKSASVEYIHEVGVNALEIVIISVTIGEVKRASFELIFTYKGKKTNQIIARGKQRVFLVNADNKIIPIPKPLKEGAREYLNKFQKMLLKIE